jgi:tmRNA-binding protein
MRTKLWFSLKRRTTAAVAADKSAVEAGVVVEGWEVSELSQHNASNLCITHSSSRDYIGVVQMQVRPCIDGQIMFASKQNQVAAV